MGDDNPFERNMDLRDAEDDVRRYAAEKYPHVAFPPELFDAILLRREGLSRTGLITFFVPEAKSDIDAAARAPDMRAFIKQKQKEGEAYVAKYGTKTSYGPLFGLAYSPIQVSAFGSLPLLSLDFDGADRHTSFM